MTYIYSDEGNPTRVIVWDLGRRCNFDCSYCTAWMHSTTAPFNQFEKLKKTADFIDQYVAIYQMYEKKPFRNLISFTGGEPAVNPAFYELVPYLKERLPDYNLSLTTNGTWSKRRGQFLLDNMDSITVSYHAEGAKKLKDLCMDNIDWLHEQGGKVRVNVMMHMDHWDECVSICAYLKLRGIKYTPRVIGDDGRQDTDWRIDDDGQKRRTSHHYTADQLDYIKNHFGGKSTKKPKDGLATKLGRMCCGGRCMSTDQGDTMFIEQTNFKGYNCMVNWFFLHIEEDRDAIYHHQTCRAKFTEAPQERFDELLYSKGLITEKTGPIARISNYIPYLMWLENEFALGNRPTMVCPNSYCGCGICIGKASTDETFDWIKSKYIY